MEPALDRPPNFAGSFASLEAGGVPGWLIQVVREMGFEKMTPVQASVIPLAMKNKDLLVEAVTGSGKTLAYVLPLLARLIAHEARTDAPLRKNEVFGIIVVPTRELAVQVCEVVEVFVRWLRREAGVLQGEAGEGEEGGVKAEDTEGQDASGDAAPSTPVFASPLLLISGQKTPSNTPPPPAPLLIATPGRLAAYLTSVTPSASLVVSSYAKSTRLLSFNAFDTLVLDEADQMLSSPDHLRSMRTIWGLLPRQRRNWLFSATMMDVLATGQGIDVGKGGLEAAGLRNLVRVVVRVERKRKGEADEEGDTKRIKGEESEAAKRAERERRTPVSLQNTYLFCAQAEKLLQLVRLLQYETQHGGAGKFIVYMSTCAGVEYFYRIFKRLPALANFHISSLHGHLPANARTTTLATFTAHASLPTAPSVLLCTDVAARGLDLPDVDVVVQFDPPADPKVFSHRAGRAARMGRKGKGIVLLVQDQEDGYIEFLALRKIPLRSRAYLDASLAEVDEPDASAPGPSIVKQRPVDPAALQLMEDIRDISLTDREFADKGAKAYVSAVRAYTKHEASYIFQLKSLDMFGLGVAFGLLRLPKMPEVKAWRQKREAAEKMLEKGVDGAEMPGDGLAWTDRSVDWDEYAYASKPREAARLKALAEELASDKHKKQAEAAAERRLKSERATAWSVQKDRRDRKEIRREKKEKRKDWEERVRQAEEAGLPPPGSLLGSKRLVAKVDKLQEEDDFANHYSELRKQFKTQRRDDGSAKEMATATGLFDDLS